MALSPIHTFLLGLFASVLMLLAIIPANLAETRGRSFLRWYLYSLALFPFALFHAILIYEKPGEEIRELKTTIIEYLNQSPHYEEVFGRRSYWDEVMVRSSAEVNSNCPVDALVATIRFNTGQYGCMGRLDFINISEKTICAIKVHLAFRNLTASGMHEKTSATAEWLIQTRPAAPGEVYSSDYSIPLSGIHLNSKSEMQLMVEHILYSDESIWTNFNNRGLFSLYYDPEKSLDVINLRLLAGDDANGYASVVSDHWICVCGSLNRDELEQCRHCRRYQENVLTQFGDKGHVNERLKIYTDISAELERMSVPMVDDMNKVSPARPRRRKEFVIVMILVLLSTDMLLGIHAGLSLDIFKRLSYEVGQFLGSITGVF